MVKGHTEKAKEYLNLLFTIQKKKKIQSTQQATLSYILVCHIANKKYFMHHLNVLFFC